MTVAALHKRMNTRFSRLGRRLDARFKASDARIDLRFKAVDARFNASDARFDMIDRQLREILRRIELLAEKNDSKTRNLEESVSVCNKVLDEHEERIGDLAAPSL
jgi:hypothetical protein